MKRALIILAILAVASGGLYAAVRFTRGDWAGVDETVVERFAEQAGRSPREPYINTDRGDLLLFVFLTAGVVGGFVGGYYFRGLFPPRTDATSTGATHA